jgi:glycosyltransferase involved in cell wall biosynthesis
VRQVPVSVVIPAFNEAQRLPRSLPPLLAALRRMPGAELIVVDDGSVDDTAVVAGSLLTSAPFGQVIRLPWNSGKGAAVRVGVAAATGDAIVFMDADMASDIADLPALVAALERAEVVLGSRRVGRGAVRTTGRQLGSWAFNQLTRSLVDLDIADTQCGFKAFRGAEAKILFSLARSNGFGFDVEVLAIAQAMGYRIVEMPVRWAETPGGTFRVARHTPFMIAELVRARRYARYRGKGALPGLGASSPTVVQIVPDGGQHRRATTADQERSEEPARGPVDWPSVAAAGSEPRWQRPTAPPGITWR